MSTTSNTVEVKAPDGAMTAHLARPSAPGTYPAVIVVMEAFGLNGHIKSVADRIAAAGYVALAPDVYYREKDAVVGYDNLDAAIGFMSGLVDDKIAADIGAAISYLQSQEIVDGDRIGITGFCMGGRISFLSACRQLPVKAAAPFYGGGIGGLLDQADRISCPMLLFYGDKDPFIPNEEIAQVKETLAELGMDAEVRVYAGAEHGFFCDERDSYNADAAPDAWTRLNDFLAKHLKS